MVNLPKEINKILKEIERAGFEAYVVGGCVRDLIMGRNPADWDIATSARFDEIIKIFPDAEVLSEKLSVVRLGDFDGTQAADIAAFRIEGAYSDYRRPDEVTFTDDINKDLERRDFTINAIAYNPSRSIVDPFGGREDIRKRLIRTIGDPLVRFEEDPIRMMRAIRLAAKLDFDLPKIVHEAIVKKAPLLEKIGVDAIRSEFERIITAEQAGKGLRMLARAELMPAIIGEAADKMTRRQLEQFNGLTDGIDNTKKDLNRSLGLFYRCFEKNGLKAVEKLHYDGKTYQHLVDALTQFEQVFFLANKMEFKQYIHAVGLERYEYMHNLAKAQHIVYGKTDMKVDHRNHMMREIEEKSEPIFIEDLAIDGNDLIEAGIAEGPKIGAMLDLLLDAVYQHPDHNDRENLLAYAEQFNKRKIRTAFRKVKWLR